MGEGHAGEIKARDLTRGKPTRKHTRVSEIIKKEGGHQAWNSQRVVKGRTGTPPATAASPLE